MPDDDDAQQQDAPKPPHPETVIEPFVPGPCALYYDAVRREEERWWRDRTD